MSDGTKVDDSTFDQKIEIEKLIQMLLLSSDVGSSVSSDPQYVECVAKLSSLRLDQLASTPDRIKKEEESIQHKTEQLAVENYPIFLANANTSREVHREFLSISESNVNLLSSIAGVSGAAQTIFDNVGRNAASFRVSAKSIQKYTQISEFLELPQLMQACIQNGYYQDALNILNHTKQIAKKYGRCVPIVRTVALQAQQISSQLYSQLCKQLREPITLPVCLKVVIYLRQLDAFTEQELRLIFLQSRGICIKDQLEMALAKPIGMSSLDISSRVSSSHQYVEYKAFIRAMRRIEVTRVQLFDSITQYRAVFADEDGYASRLSDSHQPLQQQPSPTDISPLCLEDSTSGRAPRYPSSSTANQIDDLGPSSESSLFNAWLVHQIGVFLDGLVGDLAVLLSLPRYSAAEVSDRIQLAMVSEAASLDITDVSAAFQQIHSIMTQALYFGRSIARIGCDFRAHLAAIFSRSILAFFETLLTNALTELAVVLELWPWELVEPAFLTNQSGQRSINGEVVAPMVISRHPPIAFFCNRFLTALNGLRICCPVGLRDGLLSACLQTLKGGAEAITRAHKSRQLETDAARNQSLRLALTYAHVAVPHLFICLLEHVFGGDEASHLWQLHSEGSTGQETSLDGLEEGLPVSQTVSLLSRRACESIFGMWGQLAEGPLPEEELDSPNPKVSRVGDEELSAEVEKAIEEVVAAAPELELESSIVESATKETPQLSDVEEYAVLSETEVHEGLAASAEMVLPSEIEEQEIVDEDDEEIVRELENAPLSESKTTEGLIHLNSDSILEPIEEEEEVEAEEKVLPVSETHRVEWQTAPIMQAEELKISEETTATEINSVEEVSGPPKESKPLPQVKREITRESSGSQGFSSGFGFFGKLVGAISTLKEENVFDTKIVSAVTAPLAKVLSQSVSEKTLNSRNEDGGTNEPLFVKPVATRPDEASRVVESDSSGIAEVPLPASSHDGSSVEVNQPPSVSSNVETEASLVSQSGTGESIIGASILPSPIESVAETEGSGSKSPNLGSQVAEKGVKMSPETNGDWGDNACAEGANIEPKDVSKVESEPPVVSPVEVDESGVDSSTKEEVVSSKVPGEEVEETSKSSRLEPGSTIAAGETLEKPNQENAGIGSIQEEIITERERVILEDGSAWNDTAWDEETTPEHKSRISSNLPANVGDGTVGETESSLDVGGTYVQDEGGSIEEAEKSKEPLSSQSDVEEALKQPEKGFKDDSESPVNDDAILQVESREVKPKETTKKEVDVFGDENAESESKAREGVFRPQESAADVDTNLPRKLEDSTGNESAWDDETGHNDSLVDVESKALKPEDASKDASPSKVEGEMEPGMFEASERHQHEESEDKFDLEMTTNNSEDGWNENAWGDEGADTQERVSQRENLEETPKMSDTNVFIGGETVSVGNSHENRKETMESANDGIISSVGLETPEEDQKADLESTAIKDPPSRIGGKETEPEEKERATEVGWNKNGIEIGVEDHRHEDDSNDTEESASSTAPSLPVESENSGAGQMEGRAEEDLKESGSGIPAEEVGNAWDEATVQGNEDAWKNEEAEIVTSLETKDAKSEESGLPKENKGVKVEKADGEMENKSEEVPEESGVKIPAVDEGDSWNDSTCDEGKSDSTPVILQSSVLQESNEGTKNNSVSNNNNNNVANPDKSAWDVDDIQGPVHEKIDSGASTDGWDENAWGDEKLESGCGSIKDPAPSMQAKSEEQASMTVLSFPDVQGSVVQPEVCDKTESTSDSNIRAEADIFDDEKNMKVSDWDVGAVQDPVLEVPKVSWSDEKFEPGSIDNRDPIPSMQAKDAKYEKSGLFVGTKDFSTENAVDEMKNKSEEVLKESGLENLAEDDEAAWNESAWDEETVQDPASEVHETTDSKRPQEAVESASKTSSSFPVEGEDFNLGKVVDQAKNMSVELSQKSGLEIPAVDEGDSWNKSAWDEEVIEDPVLEVQEKVGTEKLETSKIGWNEDVESGSANIRGPVPSVESAPKTDSSFPVASESFKVEKAVDEAKNKPSEVPKESGLEIPAMDENDNWNESAWSEETVQDPVLEIQDACRNEDEESGSAYIKDSFPSEQVKDAERVESASKTGSSFPVETVDQAKNESEEPQKEIELENTAENDEAAWNASVWDEEDVQDPFLEVQEKVDPERPQEVLKVGLVEDVESGSTNIKDLIPSVEAKDLEPMDSASKTDSSFPVESESLKIEQIVGLAKNISEELPQGSERENPVMDEGDSWNESSWDEEAIEDPFLEVQGKVDAGKIREISKIGLNEDVESGSVSIKDPIPSVDAKDVKTGLGFPVETVDQTKNEPAEVPKESGLEIPDVNEGDGWNESAWDGGVLPDPVLEVQETEKPEEASKDVRDDKESGPVIPQTERKQETPDKVESKVSIESKFDLREAPSIDDRIESTPFTTTSKSLTMQDDAWSNEFQLDAKTTNENASSKAAVAAESTNREGAAEALKDDWEDAWGEDVKIDDEELERLEKSNVHSSGVAKDD